MRTKCRKLSPWACFLHSGPRMSVQESMHARGCQCPGLDHVQQEHFKLAWQLQHLLQILRVFGVRQHLKSTIKKAWNVSKQWNPFRRERSGATATSTMVSADSLRTSSRDPENCIMQLQMIGSPLSALWPVCRKQAHHVNHKWQH